LIVDEAERLIGEGGYDSLRLRDIADALGIRVPSIYAHFSGREAVVMAVADRYMEIFAQQFPYDGQADPARALEDGIALLIRSWASNPCYLRLKLRDLELGVPEFDAVSGGTPEENQEFGVLAPMFARLESILKRGVEAGTFAKVEKLEMIHAIFGTALLALTYPGRRFLDGVASEGEQDAVIAEVTHVAFSLLRPH
jgi:AcrR family transcriptional regulator